MSTEWTVTFDCANPAAQAAFWQLALGYVAAPPPEGFASWDDWLQTFGVPEDERKDSAYLVDPDGVLPRMSFLKVPEGKVANNRLHLNIQAGGGRSEPFDVRWPRIMALVEQLTAAGATVIRQHTVDDTADGTPDHMEMVDPEGNLFCVV